MAGKVGRNRRSIRPKISNRFISQNLRNGWAVGDKGVIAITDDGGRHWTVQKTEVSMLLLDVFFLNSKIGWIAGQDGVLYTENGGKTWHHQDVSDFQIKGVFFVNKDRGWTVGDYDRIFVTTDSSDTWRRQDNLVKNGYHVDGL